MRVEGIVAAGVRYGLGLYHMHFMAYLALFA